MALIFDTSLISTKVWAGMRIPRKRGREKKGKEG